MAQQPPLTGSALAHDLFEDMNTKATNTSDLDQRVVEEIESLCMNCHKDGTTRLLLTRIPFFREIVIMSFSCPHCHFRNNEIQSAGQIQPKGARYALRVENEADLQRQVVKSDNCIFRIEDLDLEVPGGRGQYTNIEGVVQGILTDLESHQDERMKQMPDVGAKVGRVIRGLQDMVNGLRYPFMVSADDPTGNSWIEPHRGEAAGKWAKVEYPRTPAQNAAIGLGEEEESQPETSDTGAPATDIRPEYHATGLVGGDLSDNATLRNEPPADDSDIIEDQVYSFPSHCPGCTRPCATNMKMVSIPFFKQVVLMSTVCEDCGYRSNEVKTGGEVPAKGKRITLKVDGRIDLARDILKSESAALECPELQLHVQPGTMGGRFTTVEGILTQIRRDLRAQAFGLEDGDADVTPSGDSSVPESQRTWEAFFAELGEAIEGTKPFTLILSDPLAGSYVQSLTAPEPDPQIEVEEYDRTQEEEDDLGLSDIKTEGYEEEHEKSLEGMVKGAAAA